MVSDVKKLIQSCITLEQNDFVVSDPDLLRNEVIDKLVREAVFSEGEARGLSRFIIWSSANFLGACPSSINNLYFKRGSGEIPSDFTVPAINVRGITYDMCRAIFASAIKLDTKAFIFEIARSEMGYTDQTPEEFATVVLAAAIKEGYTGPVFIQGDHYQAKSDVPGVPKDGDIDEIKKLIKDSINSGFYNIDIDMSTLVDLSKLTESEQQVSNIKYSRELMDYIRSLETDAGPISIGCEIGHIGDKNSTVSDFEAFVSGFSDIIKTGKGMSKIAVQTGTSHGGVVKPDGTIAKVDVDFAIHRDISAVAKERFGIGGTVQHGASTLPEEMFNQFPKNQTLEIHLATGFQNMIFDHPDFPGELTQKIYSWLDSDLADEKEDGQTEEQFHYKTRKKAWGKFKKDLWSIDEQRMKEIRGSLSSKFELLFRELNVVSSSKVVDANISFTPKSKKLGDFGVNESNLSDVGNLSD